MNTFYSYYFYSRYKCVEDSFQKCEKLEVRKRETQKWKEREWRQREERMERKRNEEGNESVSFMAL